MIRRAAALPIPAEEALPRDPLRLPGGAGNTTRGEGVRRGVGFAVGFKNICYSEGFDDSCAARVVLRADGSAEVHCAAAEVGQGVVGVILQVARTELGTDDVSLASHTTATVGSAGSASASRMTWMAAGAVRDACRAALEERERTGGEVDVERVYRHPRTTPLDPETGQITGERAHVALAVAAMRVVVEVDVELGLTRVVWIGTAQDVGKAVNPLAVEGQIEGGTAQGLGLALMEEIVTRDGQILNASFTDYLLPTTLDMPPVDIDLVEVAEPDAPYGAKGVGEPPTVVSTAAIVSARPRRDRSPADARARAARRRLPLRSDEATGEQLRERRRRGVGIELERPGAADVREPAALRGDVEALGPGGERLADGIVHAVDEHRHRQAQSFHARARSGEPLVERHVLAQEDALVDVRLHLPLVERMGLGDVDEHDARPVAHAPIQLFHVAGPATERRSGEAAEDEQQRPLTGNVAERDGRPVVEPGGGEVGQRIADSEPVGTPVSRDGRHDDLALVSVELLGVRAVARIEEVEARIVGGRHGRTVPQRRQGPEPRARRRCTDGMRHARSVLTVALCCAALGTADRAEAATAAVHADAADAERTADGHPVSGRLQLRQRRAPRAARLAERHARRGDPPGRRVEGDRRGGRLDPREARLVAGRAGDTPDHGATARR